MQPGRRGEAEARGPVGGRPAAHLMDSEMDGRKGQTVSRSVRPDACVDSATRRACPERRFQRGAQGSVFQQAPCGGASGTAHTLRNPGGGGWGMDRLPRPHVSMGVCPGPFSLQLQPTAGALKPINTICTHCSVILFFVNSREIYIN